MQIIGIMLLGLIMGSFGSVLITRRENISRKKITSSLRGRSQCPHCQTTLKPKNLIPLYSRIKQTGKCAHCHHAISTLYIHTEIYSVIIFFISFQFLSASRIGLLTLHALLFSSILRLLTLLAIHDRHTQTLHMPLRIITAITSIIFLSIYYPHPEIIILGAVFLSTFGLIYLLAKLYAQHRYNQPEGFGLGDVLLSPIIGGLIGISLGGLLYHDVITIIIAIAYYLIIACTTTIMFFMIQKTSYPQSQRTSSIAFIPGMVISMVCLLFFLEKFVG